MSTKYKFHDRDKLYLQQDNPVELFDLKILHQKPDYIHYNPVVAGIVGHPEDYLYSSVRNYWGSAGVN